MRCEYHKHYEQGTLVSKIEETRQNNVYFKSKQNGIAEAVRLKLCHCYAFMRTWKRLLSVEDTDNHTH